MRETESPVTPGLSVCVERVADDEPHGAKPRKPRNLPIGGDDARQAPFPTPPPNKMSFFAWRKIKSGPSLICCRAITSYCDKGHASGAAASISNHDTETERVEFMDNSVEKARFSPAARQPGLDAISPERDASGCFSSKLYTRIK